MGSEAPDGSVVATIDGIVIEDATNGVTEPDVSDQPAAEANTITSRLISGLRAPGALVWVLIAARGAPGREEFWCRVHNFDQTTEELRASVNIDCKVLPWRAGHLLTFGHVCVREVLTRDDWLGFAGSLNG